MRRAIVAVALTCSLLAVLGAGQLDKQIGYGAGAGLQHVGSVSHDTITYIIAGSEVFGNGAWDAGDNVHPHWGPEPDSILVDTAGEYMRFLQIDRDLADTPAASYSGDRLYTCPRDTAIQPWASQMAGAVWCDLSFVPGDVRLISVRICSTYYADPFILSQGFVVGITSTTAADSVWLSTDLNSDWRVVQSSWNDMDENDSAAWNPVLDNRTGFYSILGDIGSRALRGDVTTDDPVSLEVTVGTQARLDAGLLPYWWLGGYNPTGGQQIIRLRANTIGDTTDADKSIFFRVTYTTNPDGGPYPGGKNHVFIFTSDDASDRSGEVYIPCFQNRGLRFQMCVRGNGRGGWGAEYMDEDELLATSQTGVVDFSYHTWTHYTETASPPYDVNFGYIVDPDSLRAELSAAWLAGVIGQDSTAIKSVAYPGGTWQDSTVAFIRHHLPNYIGGRSTVSNQVDVMPFYHADLDTTESDGGLFTIGKLDWDVLLQPGFSAETVEAKMDSLYALYGTRPVIILSHGPQDDPYIQEGDSTQVGYALDHNISLGDVWTCTLDEYLVWYTENHTQAGIEWTWDW